MVSSRSPVVQDPDDNSGHESDDDGLVISATLQINNRERRQTIVGAGIAGDTTNPVDSNHFLSLGSLWSWQSDRTCESGICHGQFHLMTSVVPVRVPSKACHNCRRRRLRCDRSYPTCLKCAANGSQCLGYGGLLRWTHAVASRGKMAGRTTFEEHSTQSGHVVADAPVTARPVRMSSTLIDPLFHELGTRGQFYAHHCMLSRPYLRFLSYIKLNPLACAVATSVCSDLVSYDQPEQNPFRFMIPLMGKFPYLRDIVLATSAMHLATHRRCEGRPVGAELVHALSARGQAIRQLRAAMARITDENRSPILATVVFLVNFDLVDSGRGTWKAHLDAAGVLINSLHGPSSKKATPANTVGLDSTMARLVDVVIADCLTYHILGSTLAEVDERAASVYDNIDISAVLHRAEAYSYHCCPPTILQIVVCATRLGVDGGLGSLPVQALAFDVRGWVDNIANLSINDDREARVRLASAHRAAACLYIILTVPQAIGRCRDGVFNSESLVAEILHHLSCVPADHVLFKGSVWPSFMAGAQTDDPKQRQWCMLRMRSMWRSSPWICPWGYVETAMVTLESVWATRDALSPKEKRSWNWLKQLKASGNIDCLIV
ncbi:acriflavine sensitivity control protein acr-2 [Coniochaeta sp. 2T2.1]|nr:acriflavine sensitivity control protein acr-2 [Coniochaeta sp. 2T2.1]